MSRAGADAPVERFCGGCRVPGILSGTMTRREPLPPHLAGRPFHVNDALAAGVSPGRMRASDLEAPFRGVRADAAVRTHGERAGAYARIMPDEALFTHVTAAHLLGAPLPRRVIDGPVHVSVLAPETAPRVRGVVGHRLTPRAYRWRRVGELRVLEPSDVWVQLASVLTLDELIIVGDFFITGSEPFDGRPPLTTLEALEEAALRAGSARGIRTARAALGEIRYGCLSPQETRLRLLIERAGLPAPVLNHRVFDQSGRTLLMFDGAYPEHMVAYEYMGDHHRVDKSTYRNDMVRRGRAEDLGWTQLDISADDLELRPLETLARLARRLRRAGAPIAPVESAVVAGARAQHPQQLQSRRGK